ncbi:hypothetical protein, partial [Rhodococcus olei]|uniref:hypothetical protein n=1 Tax=Rhodococcus olei TaxID=2161675 RepID=UPI0031EDCF54
MISESTWRGLVQVVLTAAASAFAFWVVPSLNKEVVTPVTVVVLYFGVFILLLPVTGYLARVPAIRRVYDLDRARFLGKYVSARRDAKASIVTISYRRGRYHLSGHTFDTDSGDELGEWSSSALDFHRWTLRYMVDSSGRRNTVGLWCQTLGENLCR